MIEVPEVKNSTRIAVVVLLFFCNGWIERLVSDKLKKQDALVG